MAKLLDINLDVSKLDDVIAALARMDQTELVGLTVGSVNKVATAVHKRNIERISSGINLSQAYLQDNLKLTLASEGQALPRATVTSPVRNVTLARFDARQHSKPVKWSNERIISLGKKFSKWRGWTQRTGDPLRGIDPDYKADGMDVTVTRGKTPDINSAFLVPLKNGGGRMGVFQWRNGGMKHLYGPAVYQMFRNHVIENADQIQEELFTTVRDQVDLTIREAFQ
jgi:hypothetical protein